MRAKAFFIAALLAVFSFTSCDVEHVSVSSQIKGKWVLVQTDGKDIPTDGGFLITFTSPSTANISMLVDSFEGDWARQVPVTTDYNGDTVTLNGSLNDDISYNVVMRIKTLYDDMMICDCKVREIIGLNEIYEEYTGVFLRDDVDYSQEIVGTWEGDELREDDSGLPDGVKCRFEFLADGTYNYYRQAKDGSWEKSLDAYSQYFCDGDVLFMRWRNLGFGTEPNSISWEFEIRKDMMRWEALRMREDGSIYRVTLDFRKV